MSDYKGAAKGYDADRFRQALAEQGVTVCIPLKSNRNAPADHDRTLYRQRHRIENTFGRLKDWRRIDGRYDRYARQEARGCKCELLHTPGTDTGRGKRALA